MSELMKYLSGISNALGWWFSVQIDWKGVWANFLGGLGVVIILFLYRELFRPKKNLSGEWQTVNLVQSSDDNSFINLKVVWKMHILENGETISGSGEKVKDINPDGSEYEYQPAQRDSVELQGYVEKNYFRKTRIFINVIQNGHLRKSRATYILKYKESSELIGTFLTTAGNSRGISIFTKNS